MKKPPRPKKEKKLTPAKVEDFEEETRMSMTADIKPIIMSSASLSNGSSVDNRTEKGQEQFLNLFIAEKLTKKKG